MKASSAADFGNGWAIETPGCSPDPGTNPCEPGSDEEVAAGDTCAIITAEGKSIISRNLSVKLLTLSPIHTIMGMKNRNLFSTENHEITISGRIEVTH